MHLPCALVMDMNMLGCMICRDIFHMFIFILPCLYFCHDLFVVLVVMRLEHARVYDDMMP